MGANAILPISEFGLDAITQKLIAEQHREADAKNKVRIQTYTLRCASVMADNEQRSGLVPPLQPEKLPDPPQLFVIDDAKIAAIEAGTLAPDAQFWTFTPYKPPFHISLPKDPPVTVISATEVPTLPGYYQAESGDGVFNAPGTQVVQDGVTYTKHTFGPFGSAAWKKETTAAQPATT